MRIREIKIAMLFLGVLASSVVLVSSGCTIAEQEHSYKPKWGVVPNAESAERIAYAVWVPIYGKENIESQKPFLTELDGNTWVVEGSLVPRPGVAVAGGTAYVEIDKRSGKVGRVSHTQ